MRGITNSCLDNISSKWPSSYCYVKRVYIVRYTRIFVGCLSIPVLLKINQFSLIIKLIQILSLNNIYMMCFVSYDDIDNRSHG